MEERNDSYVLNKDVIGEIRVADEVIAVVAGIAAAETEGVVSLAGKIKKEDISRLGMKALTRGLSILISDSTVKADVSIEISANYMIKDVCSAVQERVSSAIENMTGLQVSEVNVTVSGVVEQ